MLNYTIIQHMQHSLHEGLCLAAHNYFPPNYTPFGQVHCISNTPFMYCFLLREKILHTVLGRF